MEILVHEKVTTDESQTNLDIESTADEHLAPADKYQQTGRGNLQRSHRFWGAGRVAELCLAAHRIKKQNITSGLLPLSSNKKVRNHELHCMKKYIKCNVSLAKKRQQFPTHNQRSTYSSSERIILFVGIFKIFWDKDKLTALVSLIIEVTDNKCH